MLAELQRAFEQAQRLTEDEQRDLAKRIRSRIFERFEERGLEARIRSQPGHDARERLEPAEPDFELRDKPRIPQAPAFQEACVAWCPIPERFNGNWAVDVQHIEEGLPDALERHANVSVMLAAYTGETSAEEPDVGAWRLDFQACWAFRHRIIGYQGAASLTRPNGGAAFWEIAPSHFLVESGVLGAYGGPRSSEYLQGHGGDPHYRTFHHYIILSAIHDVYEFIATECVTEQLPERYAKTFSDPFPGW